MRVYLDNCCYNRPYDDQSQMRISLEAQAKLHIQDLIRDDELELAASYVLAYENSRNPYPYKRLAIARFLEDHTTIYVDESHSEEVTTLPALGLPRDSMLPMPTTPPAPSWQDATSC